MVDVLWRYRILPFHELIEVILIASDKRGQFFNRCKSLHARITKSVPFEDLIIGFFPLVIEDLHLGLFPLYKHENIAIIKLINVDSDLSHGLDDKSQ